VGLVYVYMDGSGKLQRDGLVCFAAVGGNFDQVNRFEGVWKWLLKERQLQCLSMKQALLADKPLSGLIPAQTVDDRNRALMPFAAAVRASFQNAVCVVVNTADFKSLTTVQKDALGSNPDALSFGIVALRMLDLLPDDGHAISLVSDLDEQIVKDCFNLWTRMRVANAAVRKSIPAITFADDQVFVQIQAADMLGALCRRMSEKEAFGRKFDYQPLYRTLVEDTPLGPAMGMSLHYLEAARLVALADDLRERKWRFPAVDLTPLMPLIPDVARHDESKP
jgi:hypothetical protein